MLVYNSLIYLIHSIHNNNQIYKFNLQLTSVLESSTFILVDLRPAAEVLDAETLERLAAELERSALAESEDAPPFVLFNEDEGGPARALV